MNNLTLLRLEEPYLVVGPAHGCAVGSCRKCSLTSAAISKIVNSIQPNGYSTWGDTWGISLGTSGAVSSVC